MGGGNLKPQFAFHVADTHLTLKQGQGYQNKVITMQSLKDLTVSKKKAMLKFLSNQEQVTYLWSLEYMQSNQK